MSVALEWTLAGSTPPAAAPTAAAASSAAARLLPPPRPPPPALSPRRALTLLPPPGGLPSPPVAATAADAAKGLTARPAPLPAAPQPAARPPAPLLPMAPTAAAGGVVSLRRRPVVGSPNAAASVAVAIFAGGTSESFDIPVTRHRQPCPWAGPDSSPPPASGGTVTTRAATRPRPVCSWEPLMHPNRVVGPLEHQQEVGRGGSIGAATNRDVKPSAVAPSGISRHQNSVLTVPQ
ncbi:hypothetical protein BU14_1639s0002 [Porphyra umbilicalis]|uniref:Uncharacterized protein n=1 Tax=Porphyra umbilicalis TaxID=2786 RepID=A0A1X6NL94_PORUM|nr:hypothetical protein BU14_1639s0002 [Porphyra umbilicalis]|eukprot:OSX69300.1 hypothetical protein BU14_1639s0002 [Porphyra umbilicalis]